MFINEGMKAQYISKGMEEWIKQNKIKKTNKS